MAKKFKIRTKSSKLGQSEIAALIADTGSDDHPKIRAVYEAVLGTGRPVSRAICSDTVAMSECSRNLCEALFRMFQGEDAEYGVELTRIATSPIDQVRLHIAQARKVSQRYAKAGVDGLFGLRLCPTTDARRLDCIALDAFAIIGGPDAQSKLIRAEQKARSGKYLRQSPRSWQPASGRKALRETLQSLFDAPWAGLPNLDPFHHREAPFSGVWDAPTRRFVTLMCRSQLPMRNMLIGIGAGKAIVSSAHMSAEHNLNGRCRSAPEVVHRDEVPHLWFDELRRRGLTALSVPKLLLH